MYARLELNNILPLSWFGWRHIMTKGVFEYYENKKTKERAYKQIHNGYSALDTEWLEKKGER